MSLEAIIDDHGYIDMSNMVIEFDMGEYKIEKILRGDTMGKKLLQFKVWGGKVDYKYPMMIWSEDADIAFYRIARGIEPSVTSIEWTGEYIEPDKVVEALKKEGKEK